MLEVLGEGFGEDLLTRRVSPILPGLKTDWHEGQTKP